MKKFLRQVSLFSTLLLLSMLAVFFMADGTSDPYYLRFTSSQQSSLIIGSSRAAQGLQPAVFNEIVYKNAGKQFYNYAFSLLDSPFGNAYYESIKKKLNPRSRDGIFIISVDPWSISSETLNPNDKADFPESKNFIGKTKYVNLYPNIPYLVRSYNQPYMNIITNRGKRSALYLHKDGWLEVNAPMDSVAVEERLAAKLTFYRKNYLPVYRISNERLNYLSKTIKLLQQYGRVYLVRLPVHKAMLAIENELMPEFDLIIDSITKVNNVPFLNFGLLTNQYQYVDGHHLYKASGKEVSALIASWILQTSLRP